MLNNYFSALHIVIWLIMFFGVVIILWAHRVQARYFAEETFVCKRCRGVFHFLQSHDDGYCRICSSIVDEPLSVNDQQVEKNTVENLVRKKDLRYWLLWVVLLLPLLEVTFLILRSYLNKGL